MPTRVDAIVGDVISRLSQVPGIATQIYAADRIRGFVQDAWLLEIEELWWPDYMFWFNVGLDGVSGSITQDLIGPISAIEDYGDIALVFPIDGGRRLSALPPNSNPFIMDTQTTPGAPNRPRYVSPSYVSAKRPLRVWPSASIGNIAIWARQRHPIPLGKDDNVYLDRLLLTYDAAWMYAIDDGTIPEQVSKFQMLAKKRRDQMKASFAQHPLALDPRMSTDSVSLEGQSGSGTQLGEFVLDVSALS